MSAGAARRELDATDVSGERKVGVVEFTDSAHGQASQETRLLGRGRSRLGIPTMDDDSQNITRIDRRQLPNGYRSGSSDNEA